MRSQWLDLRLKNPKLPEWFTAQQASSTSSSSNAAGYTSSTPLSFCTRPAYFLWRSVNIIFFSSGV